MHNLVEIEFFHMGRNQDPEFEEVIAAGKKYIQEALTFLETGIEPATRNKTVIRFYDVDRVLTQLALEVKRINSAKAESMQAFNKAGWLKRKCLDLKIRRLAGQLLSLGKLCKRQAVKELRKAIMAKRVIAIEVSDIKFRLARKDEFTELLETAEGSYSVWISVFEPNDLFSLTNKAIAQTI